MRQQTVERPRSQKASKTIEAFKNQRISLKLQLSSISYDGFRVKARKFSLQRLIISVYTLQKYTGRGGNH
jgi:hypothetical protein